MRNRVSITERPAQVETRERLGGWEGGGNLVTLVERKSGYLSAYPVKRRTRRQVTRAINLQFNGHVVTAIDNGPMAESLMDTGLVQHLMADGFTFVPKQPVDWMVCDIVEKPARNAALLETWIGEGHCRVRRPGRRAWACPMSWMRLPQR